MTMFLRVETSLLHTLGPDAALLDALIRFRCRGRSNGWVATYADITDAIGVTRQRIARAAELLRSESRIGTSRDGSTGPLRWYSESQIGIVGIPNRDRHSSIRETNPQLTTPDADASPPPEEQQMDEPAETEFALISEDDIPPTAPPKNGSTLVARWIDGHRSTGETDPPGPYMKRVAGQCGSLARLCATDEDWHAAWIACYQAGVIGRVDPVPLMVKARSQFEQRQRWNENTALTMLREGTTYADLPPSPMDILKGIGQ